MSAATLGRVHQPALASFRQGGPSLVFRLFPSLRVQRSAVSNAVNCGVLPVRLIAIAYHCSSFLSVRGRPRCFHVLRATAVAIPAAGGPTVELYWEVGPQLAGWG